MNYTEKYHLPQWEESDRIMMEDFNQMNHSIDSAISAAAQTAANALSTANSAKSTANSAQSAANTALASLPYAYGSYTGTGSDITVYLGFKPRFLVISGLRESSSGMGVGDFGQFGCITNGKNVSTNRLVFTSSGFTALCDPDGGATPNLWQLGRVYDYIAFK